MIDNQEEVFELNDDAVDNIDDLNKKYRDNYEWIVSI